MKNFHHWTLKAFAAVFILVLMYGCGSNSESETTVIITVRDHNSGQLVQGGSVTLYRDANDYTYDQGYRTTNTDANGQATFQGVDSGIDYYFEASQAGKDNSASTIHLGSTTKLRQTTYATTEIQ